MSYKALITGMVLFFLLGGLLPLLVQDFAVDLNDYDGYLSPLVNFVDNGFPVNIIGNVPIIGGIVGGALEIIGIDSSLSINVFDFIPGLKNFILNQIAGFALIPPVFAIPLLIIIFTMVIYGLVKLFPFS